MIAQTSIRADEPFVVYCDASKLGLDGVLM